MRRTLRVGALVFSLALASCSFGTDADERRVGTEAFDASVDAALEANTARIVDSACPANSRGHVNATARERQADMDAINLPLWQSADVGVTAQLSDGRVAWVFGDTARAKGINPRMVDNSMLLSDGRCFSQVVPRTGRSIIPSRDGRHACWPNSAMALPAKGRDILLVGCSRIERSEKPVDGLYSFEYRGLTMATFAVRPGEAPALVTTSEVTSDSADDQQINWGVALVGDSGWVYVYGSQQPPGSTGKAAYVARCKVSQVGDFDQWQFWNGATFQDDPSRVKPLIPASEGVSQTFSVVKVRDHFVMVSKQGGEFGPNVGVWSAARPQGPWRGATATPVPYRQPGGVMAYQPLAHPELPTPDGQLIVTLSRTTDSIAELFAHPGKGRPMFISVDAG